MRGEKSSRMVPYKDGKANDGHSCVKGRFAFGYATHKDRILKPMIREKITDPWREVELGRGDQLTPRQRVQAHPGRSTARDSIGGITSSRCTNEETFLVQKLVRAAFGNNNVDTCARVCHSPTGYGLKTDLRHLGRHAGLRVSVDKADVMLVIGANPTDAPSGLRLADEAAPARGRQADRHRSAPDRPRAHAARRGRLPPAAAARHQRRDASTRIGACRSSPRAWSTRQFVARALRPRTISSDWARFVAEPSNCPGGARADHRRPGRAASARAARLYATGGNGAIYYGLGVTEHSQGSTMVMAMANLAMATGNIGRAGVGVNPLRGQNNVQGSCDMGSFPHEFSGYRHVSDDADARSMFEELWGVPTRRRAGPAHPQHARRRRRRHVQGPLHPGRGHRCSPTPTPSTSPPASTAMECVVVQDLFLNETANYAHVFLPGSTFLEKDGTFTNAERRIQPRAQGDGAEATAMRTGRSPSCSPTRMGYPMDYTHPSRDHGRDRRG